MTFASAPGGHQSLMNSEGAASSLDRLESAESLALSLEMAESRELASPVEAASYQDAAMPPVTIELAHGEGECVVCGAFFEDTYLSTIGLILKWKFVSTFLKGSSQRPERR